jgi:hypothetical protein
MLGIGGAQGGDATQSTPPSKDDFAKAVKALWEDARSDNDSRWAPLTRACVQIPLSPRPDARSTSLHPLADYLDFADDTLPSEDRRQQLRQLDALAKVGILKKSAAENDIRGEMKAVSRYHFTEKGWAASQVGRGAWCLEYGTLHVLGISRFARSGYGPYGNRNVYDVIARIGFTSPNELVQWARDDDVVAAFPVIRKGLEGQEVKLEFIQADDGRWLELEEFLEWEQRQRIQRENAEGNAELMRIEKELRTRREASLRHPAPTVAEVTALLQARFAPQTANYFPQHCAPLPGSGSDYPVDRQISGPDSQGYAVAIFPGLTRRKDDPIVVRTQPYLDRLERTGVLIKRAQQKIPAEKAGQKVFYDGYVYTLAPPYADKVDPDFPQCLPMGKPTLEIVGIDIFEHTFERGSGAAFHHKVRLTYRNPMPWTRNAGLREGWPELRERLELGQACAGTIEFDRQTRQAGAGGMSCWWAGDKR